MGPCIFRAEQSKTTLYIADFENLKQAFLSMELIQKSNFRVQGMFLSLFIFLIIMVVVVRSVCHGCEDED